MLAKELLDWFPDGKILDQPVDKEDYLCLSLSNNQWLLLDYDSGGSSGLSLCSPAG